MPVVMLDMRESQEVEPKAILRRWVSGPSAFRFPDHHLLKGFK
jgi:hypothetical protein